VAATATTAPPATAAPALATTAALHGANGSATRGAGVAPAAAADAGPPSVTVAHRSREAVAARRGTQALEATAAKAEKKTPGWLISKDGADSAVK